MSKRIFIDMDGTLATWQNEATPHAIYSKNYFRNLPPTSLLPEVKRVLRSGLQDNIYILSAYIPEVEADVQKNEWLDEFLPEIPPSHRLFVINGSSKSAFIRNEFRSRITEDFVLLDDYSKNLLTWTEDGGTAVKYLNGINGKGEKWKGHSVTNFHDLWKILDI